MKNFSNDSAKRVIKSIAQEFLEERLGLSPTPERIRRFAAHIIQFEKEVKQLAHKKCRQIGLR